MMSDWVVTATEAWGDIFIFFEGSLGRHIPMLYIRSSGWTTSA